MAHLPPKKKQKTTNKQKQNNNNKKQTKTQQHGNSVLVFYIFFFFNFQNCLIFHKSSFYKTTQGEGTNFWFWQVCVTFQQFKCQQLFLLWIFVSPSPVSFFFLPPVSFLYTVCKHTHTAEVYYFCSLLFLKSKNINQTNDFRSK